MKKIYFIALSLIAFTNLNAQITLTKANTEPVIGESYFTKGLDTTGFELPNTVTGTNVTWTLTQAIEDGSMDTMRYVAPATFTNSGTYSGSTFAGYDASGTVTYYKSTPTQLEVRGVDAGFLDLNFNTNTAIVSVYPITYGYTNTDAVGGTMTVPSQSLTGPFTGTINTVADGTGTLDINGATIFTNCLRVKSTQQINFTLAFGFVTGTIDQNIYNYYHSSSKFPILSVNYQHVVASGLTAIDQWTAVADLQQFVATGIHAKKANDVIFKTYPNPATSEINLHFVVTKSENYKVEITNTLGQVVKTALYSNLNAGMYNETLNVADLKAGVYTINVANNNSKGVEKLIIQ